MSSRQLPQVSIRSITKMELGGETRVMLDGLRKIGCSVDLVLLNEAVGELDVREANKLFLNETPTGSFRLTATVTVREPAK